MRGPPQPQTQNLENNPMQSRAGVLFLKLRCQPAVARARDLSMVRFPLQARSNGVIMSRNWTLLTLTLLLSSTGALQAEPLNSPGVVYIDGQPCNRACQSYMDWSYRALSARRHEGREIAVAVPDEVEFERVEPVSRPRAAKHAAPVARTAPHAGKAASNGQGAQHQGVEQQEDRRTSSAGQSSAAGHGGRDSGKVRGRDRRRHSKTGAQGGERRPAGADSRHRRAAARRGGCVQGAGTRGQARGEG